ncbi:MAG: FGGY-family carbohydrate kinase [Terracidiphilus sp.]
MHTNVSFLAVDLGASSGRVMDCAWNGERFSLNEAHRFPNAGVRIGADLHWDVLRIWSEIQIGLRRSCTQRKEPPASIGVDSWGVDFCLLDERDRLLGNPHHYRDSRTNGVPAAVQSKINGHDLFRATGVQTMEINTVFQLAAMDLAKDRRLMHACSLLMIPDFIQFLLCGEKRAEYTNASTTEIFDLRARQWSREVLQRLELPDRIFQQIVQPGTVLGELQSGVQSECGLAGGVPCIAVASHDTASAVAAIPGMDEASVFLSSGTWSLMGVLVNEPNLSDAAFRGGFTNEGATNGRVRLLKNMTGLWILQECVRLWESSGNPCAWGDLEEAASHAPAFRSLIDPSASAFLAPTDMCAAIAQFCAASGQPVPQTKGEFARCVFESLSFAYRHVLEELERITGRSLNAIRVVGGGSLNRFLCQMTADACARPVIAGPVEASALGNASLQALATGHLRNFSELQQALRLSVELHQYEPVPTSATEQAYGRYISLVKQERSLNSAFDES